MQPIAEQHTHQANRQACLSWIAYILKECTWEDARRLTLMLAVLGGGPLAKLKVSRSLSVYWLKGSSGRCANCLHSSLH